MDRRRFLFASVAIPFLPALRAPALISSRPITTVRAGRARVRPGDPQWPAPAAWDDLRERVGGRLIKVQSPLDVCRIESNGASCAAVFAGLRNPFFIGDDPGLTQTSGWLDAWTSKPSVYAVAATSTADVVAAVTFARDHDLRLVVKGGGHSYQGTSDAPDSLLVWTRHMHAITLHDAFVASGCSNVQTPQHAVTVEAGAMWIDVYDAVTTHAGRYVQGGGCATVGVAGLVQSGGFGSFSKLFGTAASGLLEAEIVTADGAVRIANACTNPDLFWGIKGGGGGSLGVVTRLTLATHELPNYFGGISATIKATSAAAFRQLLHRFVGFYRDDLLNPHWGEVVKIQPNDTVEISMVFQGLDASQARATWRPFFDSIAAAPDDYTLVEPPTIASRPARLWWDVAYRKDHAPGSIVFDPRAGAPATHAWWSGDSEQVGVFLHAFESAWMPASLLAQNDQHHLVDALFAASRHWEVQLHFNKGLAGAPSSAVAAARQTAMNPAVLGAFALAIVAAGGPASFPGIAGHEPDLSRAREDARRVTQAMAELRAVVPHAGSYVSESNFFEKDWQHAFWGNNYPRLRAIKRRYDPAGLFFVRHGVDSEGWSDDGFTRS